MQALRVVSGDEVYIPLILHALCAGFPSPADDYLEGEVDLNRHLIANRPATFLFKVAGDCMRDAGIFDGDLLIVDRSLTPQARRCRRRVRGWRAQREAPADRGWRAQARVREPGLARLPGARHG